MTLKEELGKAVKVSRRTFFNPSKWFGYALFEAQIQATIGLIRRLFIPAQATHQETFAEAVARQGLSEADLKKAHARYLLFTAFFLLVGLIFGGYGFYLLIYYASVAGLLLSLAAAGLCLANAFRFHFMAFQIRHRKLGCTFTEWLAGKTTEEGANRR